MAAPKFLFFFLFFPFVYECHFFPALSPLFIEREREREKRKASALLQVSFSLCLSFSEAPELRVLGPESREKQRSDPQRRQQLLEVFLFNRHADDLDVLFFFFPTFLPSTTTMPLIITSKKSYNPYGKAQRLRVARDEAAAAENEEKDAARRAMADAERARIPLVRRAAERGDASAAAALKDEESLRRLFEGVGDGDRGNEAEEEEEEGEKGAARRRREEARRRGKEETRTSDARFDQQFALGGGERVKEAPWYAKKKRDREEEEEGSPRRSSSSSRSRSRSRSPKKKRSSKKEKNKKEKKERKKSSKKKEKSPSSSSLLDSLRAERMAREEAEAARAAQVVAAAGRREAAAAADAAAGTFGESGRPAPHQYNRSFGNALPASRRRGASWRELGGGEAKREVEQRRR